MSISNKQIALIHVAKSKLGLTEAEFRSGLVDLCGVTSVTELDQDGFTALMGLFEYLGFKPLTAKGPDYGARDGMASFAQLELIRTIWKEWSGADVEDGLAVWLERYFGISSLRFVTAQDARKVITALKKMKARDKAA
ncbi:MAG: regulatory protein GemA [Roseovarius sp.]|jgi:hypothetical protein|nr:regulatory protein GemA [Roseovarius sp.]